MYDELVSFAINELLLDVDEITPDCTFESLNLDSLDVVQLIMALETEYGIDLADDDLQITTFGELVELVESKQN